MGEGHLRQETRREVGFTEALWLSSVLGTSHVFRILRAQGWALQRRALRPKVEA